MSEQENLQLIQKLYEVFGRGDLPTIPGSLTDDVDWHYLGPDEMPVGRRCRGRDEVTQFFAAIAQGQDVEAFAPEEFVVQEDKVVVIGRERMKVKQTGKAFETAWVHIFDIRDGKIARFRMVSDTAAVMAAHS